MDLEFYFKKTYQVQYGGINPEIGKQKKSKMLPILKYNETLSLCEDKNSSSENFDKLPIEFLPNLLKEMLEKIESYLGENKIIQLYLLPKESWNNLEKGTYYVQFPYLLQVENYEKELQKYFSDENQKIIILISVDLKWLSSFGVQSFLDSFKQAGEISFLLKEYLKDEILLEEFDSNRNALCHAAGININRSVILSSFMLSEV
ncbi:MAG: hypothetical protein LBV67_03385 [Streptococcaceae bacterium]|jgi:hypothetical protein|nr:hypothetical protein [Streptococcaceae bacterium]